MKKIFIFGLGNYAELAEYYISQDMNLELAGYIVDDEFLNKIIPKHPVYSWSRFLQQYSPKEAVIFCAVGYKSFYNRISVYQKIEKMGFEFLSIISHHACIANNALLGKNLFIMPGVVIEPGVSIGNNNIFWSNSTVCHDVIIKDHNFFAANSTIGGFTEIGTGNFIGFSTVILQNILIGNNNLIGANSLVNFNIQEYLHIHGVPARIIKKICTKEGVKV